MTVLDALTYAGQRESLADVDTAIRLVEGDITDAELVSGWSPSPTRSCISPPKPMWTTRWTIQSRFCTPTWSGRTPSWRRSGAHGVRLHHVSTDEVYGDLELGDPKRFTESTPYNPSSPYSATKAAADMLVRAWVRSYGVRATISNCSNNYGPYQHVEKFIPRQITNVLTGRRPKLYGSGANVRDWIHVDDHNSAVWRILENGQIGQTYLIGAEGERDNLSVLRTLLKMMGRDPDDFDHVTDRVGHDLRYAIDPSLLYDELCWAPKAHRLRRGFAAQPSTGIGPTNLGGVPERRG